MLSLFPSVGSRFHHTMQNHKRNLLFWTHYSYIINTEKQINIYSTGKSNVLTHCALQFYHAHTIYHVPIIRITNFQAEVLLGYLPVHLWNFRCSELFEHMAWTLKIVSVYFLQLYPKFECKSGITVIINDTENKV